VNNNNVSYMTERQTDRQNITKMKHRW